MRHSLLALMLFSGTATAQEAYRTPPQVVVNAIDAAPLPGLSISPNREWTVLSERAALPTIAELAQPMHRLAGLRINPRTNGPYRAISNTALRFKSIADGRELALRTPPGAKLGGAQWAPDSRHIAFTVTTDDGIALWVASVASGEAWAVTEPVLNGAIGNPCAWMPDGTELVCRLIPQGRGPAPVAPAVPSGPNIETADGRAAPARTFQDLLETPHDERLFEYYATSRLARVRVQRSAPQLIGEAAIYVRVDPSPDGRHLLVEQVRRPFSYAFTWGSFPRVIDVVSPEGQLVRRVAELPLADRVPVRGVRTGPRGAHWRPNHPATLVWVEALDGGDPRASAPHRDRFVSVTMPAGEPVDVARTEFRARNLLWNAAGDLAVVYETDRATRRARGWVVSTTGSTAPRLLHDYNTEDSYADPGQFVMRQTARGEEALLQSTDGRYVYLQGMGASPEGDRPFFDRLDLRTLRAERLFRSADPHFQTVVAVLDPNATRLMMSKESAREVPNYVIRETRGGSERAFTAFQDPAPQLAGITREIVRYRRADGVQLSGTLYLPPGYTRGTRLPVVMWVYPAEFASAEAASQIRGSANRFTRIGGASHLFLLTQGYAVLDNPTLPVIGGDTANNGYVQQVIAGARAAIDHMVEIGVGDRDRMGVGGHSYGAFTTANLLAHSDLFRTGIARSGAYNRTLTPFGFQAEERTYWQARDVYTNMSPFTYADRINEPILLIHGEADDNSGTFPVQSDRLFAALKGLGATSQLVTYPFEAHGYAARETILDCVARMIEWYDRFVKPARVASAMP